jgi:hypothetical protein
MSELLYNENAFQLVDFCTQVHCELGKGEAWLYTELRNTAGEK